MRAPLHRLVPTLTEVLEVPSAVTTAASPARALPELVIDLALDAPADLDTCPPPGQLLHVGEAALSAPLDTSGFSPPVQELITNLVDAAMVDLRVMLQSRIEEAVRQALVANGLQAASPCPPLEPRQG